MRTGDVIEFVNDGVADAGVTGGDILAESGVELPVLRQLGYGRCRLVAATPADSPYEAIADLAGVRIATSHPNVTRRFFAEQGIPVEVISLSGAVEVAPRLGLADAIVDLVSTGSTLAMNGLRADRRPPRLRGGPARPTRRPSASAPDELDGIVTMLGSVIAARGRKYLMMNAPAAKLGELEALLPGLESPSVIPLAHAGHDRDPLRGRRGRGLGPAAPPQGRRGVRHPRAADREDPPVTRRRPPALPTCGFGACDLADRRPRRHPRPGRAVPPRRRAGSCRPGCRPPDPRRRPRARRRRPCGRPRPASAAVAPTGACC